MSSPNINVRGVTSAPFPGYMLIGRGADFAWTLTSAGGDIIDTFAEQLCGGSKTKYLFDGKCTAMEKLEAGTIVKGNDSVDATFYRTVHGPVLGYARSRDTGKLVALAQKRSSAGQETVDQLFNQDLTFGRVKSAADFIDAAEKTPQTFNSFYASKTESAFYTAGAIPKRAKRRRPHAAHLRDRRIRVAGPPPRLGAPADRRPDGRRDHQLEQQARGGLAGRRRPLRQRGRHPARQPAHLGAQAL